MDDHDDPLRIAQNSKYNVPHRGSPRIIVHNIIRNKNAQILITSPTSPNIVVILPSPSKRMLQAGTVPHRCMLRDSSANSARAAIWQAAVSHSCMLRSPRPSKVCRSFTHPPPDAPSKKQHHVDVCCDPHDRPNRIAHIASLIRRDATSAISGSFSIPMNRRPVRNAAMPVLPLPMQLSSIVSPSLE